MSKKIVEGILKEVTEPLQALGYEVVDAEYKREGDRNVLRFYIYCPEGITVEDCEKASGYLSDKLDELDPIRSPYYLEVSSPDLNRPLKTERDLERNLGQLVDVSFYKHRDGKKTLRGTLTAYDPETVTLEIEEKKEKEMCKLDRKDISTIKIAIVF